MRHAERIIPGMTDIDLQPFAIALDRALSEHGAKVSLARSLGVSPQLVSDWLSGKLEPSPRKAIAAEQHLGLPPGTLTVHLGYVPIDTERVDLSSPEEALIADQRLSAAQKIVLLGMLDQLTAQQEQNGQQQR